MREITPDLTSLFGRLVEPRQLQRWRAVPVLEDWPRFEPGYGRGLLAKSVDSILTQLRALGAVEQCVAVTLQGTDFAVAGSLEELVRAVCLDELRWGGKTAENTIVICNPGRLAFSKDDYAHYAIYHPP